MRVYASAEMTLTDTNDGVSVTGIDRYYMASSSSSGITIDSQGWKSDPQETNPISRYHWSYEVVNYSDGAKIPSKPAVIGVYGKDGKEGMDAVTVSLSSEAHTFAGTESKAIASSLSIDISAFKGNQRIPTSIGTVTGGISGQLTHSELDRGKTTNKLVINVTSSLDKSHGTLSIPIVADGKTFNKVFSWSVAFKGDSGKDGNPGKDGVGIQKTEVHYAKSTSGTTRPSTGWSLQVPSTSPGDYIWTRTTWTYTDGDTEEGYSVSRIGKDGNTGKDGVAGKDGVGIKSTVIDYATSSSGTTKPTSGWNPTVPSVTPGNYLWTRTVWTYTDNDTEEGYSVSRVGKDGEQGPQGPQGIRGPAGSNGQSQYVHIRYSANSNGSGMDTKPSSTTKYVGIAVTDSATAPGYTGFTWSKYVGENGSQGPQGVPGKNGANGTTTYTWVRYADTPTSGMENFPDGKKYIGLAFNKTTQTESNNYSDYQWSLMPQNIEIGGRNLLRNSGEKVSNGNYMIARYDLTDEIKEGEEVTLTIWGSLAASKSSFRAYNSGGNVHLAILTDNRDGTYSVTFKWRIGGSTNTYLNVYAFTNTQTGTSTINKIKLERGNKATDWTPAPEDLYQYVDDIEIGGRNLYRDSGRKVTSSGYNITTYNFATKPIAGEKYTLSIKGKINPQHHTGFYTNIYNGSAHPQMVTVGPADLGSDGVYRKTFTMPHLADYVSTILYSYPLGAYVEASVEWIKLEKGDKATDWSPAPEDVQSQIDDKANQTDTEARLNEIASELLVKQQEIEAAATAGELDAFVKKYNQEQEAFAKEKKASEDALASAQDAIDLITNKMDNMAETWEFFDEYIKFEKGSIVLGNETEGSHVRIHNDRISFHSSGYEVASITQGKMTIEAGTFVEEIQISEFKFQKSSNGHLTVRHVG